MGVLRWCWAVGVALLLTFTAAPLFAQGGIAPAPELPVFLPIMVGSNVAPTPIPSWEEGERVYSVLGAIESRSGRLHENYLVMHDSETVGLAGQTPELEAQIDRLAELDPPQLVKVWGIYNREGPGEGWILVTGIIGAGPAPTPVPDQLPTATVRFALVTLRGGPGQSYPATGTVVFGQACDVNGRDVRRMWWLLACENGVTGWIDSRLVELNRDASTVPIVLPTPTVEPTPTPAPSPTPTPEPVLSGVWLVRMYDNMGLRDNPKAYDTATNIDFDWRYGSPHRLLPADRFSVLYERTMEFEPGYYQFQVQADDGVRVWIDDQLVIDEWHGAGGVSYTASRALYGVHKLRVEYFEAAGLASIRLNIQRYENTPEWQAVYFNGTELSGIPVLVRQEPSSALPLDYNWSYGAPADGAPGFDLWSARWTGDFDFEGGDYMFRAIADDGVRVYVDGLRVIDRWRDGYSDTRNEFIGIGRGSHRVVVEFYERTGAAQLRVWWYLMPPSTGPR